VVPTCKSSGSGWARLSLAFRGSCSALKLYSASADRRGRSIATSPTVRNHEHFPDPFLDDWLPSHPKFGLDLVAMSQRAATSPPHLGFAAQQSGRSTDSPRDSATNLSASSRQSMPFTQLARRLQAELPGLFGPVCQIRMDAVRRAGSPERRPRPSRSCLERCRLAVARIGHSNSIWTDSPDPLPDVMEMLQEHFALCRSGFGDYRRVAVRRRFRRGRSRVGLDAAWRSAADRDHLAADRERSTCRPRRFWSEARARVPAMRIGPRVFRVLSHDPNDLTKLSPINSALADPQKPRRRGTNDQTRVLMGVDCPLLVIIGHRFSPSVKQQYHHSTRHVPRRPPHHLRAAAAHLSHRRQVPTPAVAAKPRVRSGSSTRQAGVVPYQGIAVPQPHA